MAEPTIIQEQREVVRSIQQLVDQHVAEEEEAAARLRLDREAADQALSQCREAADHELRRAFEILQESERLVQPRGDAHPLDEVMPLPPPKLFDTDLLIGMRITLAQMEARLIRIRASFTDGTSSTLITAGIIVGAVVAVGAILLMPLVANMGLGSGGMSFGWFAVMLSPLVVALLVAAARATVLRPYSPDQDYAFIRQSMGHVLYMHQVLVEEALTTHGRRLNERQERYDETKERIAQAFRQQLLLLEGSIARVAAAAAASGPEWNAPAWRTWIPSNQLPHTTCIGELLAGVGEDRLSLPALMPFPHEKALIVKADAQSRDRAISAIQSFLLRLVATVPPGDLRFILIDPVGQGQNVLPFMPFADLSLGLGEGRAWTEPHQIEQRLHDLVSLVESAADVQAFHALLPHLEGSRSSQASEPCRVLVILDFPTNFGGATARLLASLIQKGPIRGVHPLILVDTEQSPPYSMNLLELEQLSTVVGWDGRRFVWQDPDFRACWVELDKPPGSQLAKKILRGALLQPIGRSA